MLFDMTISSLCIRVCFVYSDNLHLDFGSLEFRAILEIYLCTFRIFIKLILKKSQIYCQEKQGYIFVLKFQHNFPNSTNFSLNQNFDFGIFMNKFSKFLHLGTFIVLV